MHWLEHWLGMDNLSGPIYGFFSGVGSDIGELGIIGALATHTAAYAHSVNCEVHGCWHLGHRTTAAGHRVCRRHAGPLGKLTHEDVIAAHCAALADGSTQGASTGEV